MNLPSDALAQFYGENAQIDQIIFSLLLNSKENIPAGGRVTIRTEPSQLTNEFIQSHAGAHPGQYIRLTVADTGNGIPADALPQTFERFSPTSTHESGLRLPTVYAIVKQLGGYIDVESWQGHGSRFEIYLTESRASAFSLRFFHVGLLVLFLRFVLFTFPSGLAPMGLYC